MSLAHLTYRDKEDCPADDTVSDAEGMLLHAFRAAAKEALTQYPVRVGDECVAEVKGDRVEITLPSLTLVIDRVRDADLLVNWAAGDFGVFALAVLSRVK